MEIFARTDIGKVREVNQDYVAYYQKNENECIAVLCDGMGGHQAGEIASMLTCEDIIQQYQLLDHFLDEDDIRRWLNQAIYHANQKVQITSLQKPETNGMGTTVVVVVMKEDKAYISHVGDSRAYYFDQDLKQLTSDDTLVNALLDSGTITQEEATYHPQRNILLQAVGVSDVLKISYYKQDMSRGLLLLCSDGLYNSLSLTQMAALLNHNDLEEIGNQLIEKANQNGGKDNIGIILMKGKGEVIHESDR